MPPKKNDNNKEEAGLIPIVFGLAIAGGALILLSGGSDEEEPPLGDEIALTGFSECFATVGGVMGSRIKLFWTSVVGGPALDIDFDIMRDGVTIDTVRSNSWSSPSIPAGEQGQTHTYKVLGVTPQGQASGKESNTTTIQSLTCIGGGGLQQMVTNVQASFI